MADGQLHQENWQTAGFGIYVHWPYCGSKCPYCDFNSHVASNIDHEAWAKAYETVLAYWAQQTEGRVVRSVFFGGGTPSLMEPDTVARVLEHIAKHWSLANDVEVTLEANPTSVERGRFSGFRAAGVNRISLGAQALNDPDLQRLGRLHSVVETLQAIETARSEFPRISIDLIYARQDQTGPDWYEELTRALALGLDHLSLYQLTIEPGTPFYARRATGGLKGLPDEDRAVELYEITQTLCEGAGLPSYEVSNHACPGAESRHNLIYWRGGDWLGVGPGAHGRITHGTQRIATAALRRPDCWLSAIGAGKPALEESLPIDLIERAEEYLMMSLRLTEGTDLGRLYQLGRELPKARVETLINDGLLAQRGTRIIATPRGRLLLNAVLLELLSG